MERNNRREMNQKTIIKTLTLFVVVYMVVTAWAAPQLGVNAVFGGLASDTVKTRPFLPGEIRDTAAFNEEQRARDRINYHSQMKLLVRTYGDSVVLRWAPTDYAAWRYVNRVGVDVLRIDLETAEIDTLAHILKPTPLERFRQLYPETDSTAMMGMGSIYNQKGTNPKATRDEEGSMGSLFDIHQDQQMQLGVAVLVSEWRPDVANHMAMRWVDRTAKRGKKYSYSVVSSEIDSTMTVMLDAGVVDDVVNESVKPEPFDVTLRDSVTAPYNVQISWEDKNYSSYEIERREKGTTKWMRLNQRPYIMMTADLGGNDCFYGDVVTKPGTYEYRIFAHDPFGELTEPSAVHTVRVGDLVAPRPPMITRIVIDRPREDDPSAEVWADIHFVKDTMEADYVGCVPMYYHERITEGQWRPLTEKPLSPSDTVCRVNVTNLVTGDIVMAAYDTAHNVGYSIPQLLRVSDMRPPKAPTGLRAVTDAVEGTITLVWDALKDDDISYYEIVFANDSTHRFMTARNGIAHDTVWTDTVAMDVNQKYIYYKVRAVDYSTNIGAFSDMLQVIRPSNVPPLQAHLDSASVNGQGVYMRWIAGNDELVAYHHVLRRKESQHEWTLLQRCDADSVKAQGNIITIVDTPDASINEQWVYAVESFNYSKVSSLSLQYLVRFEGEKLFSWPIKLMGAYQAEQHETRLAWEMEANPPYSGEWYFCIYRKGPEDKAPKFLMSADAGDRDFSDRLLQAGESASYYIMIQYADGRCSRPSDTITVTAPAKKE